MRLTAYAFFIVILCFQIGFFGYQFIFEDDDVRLQHRLHQDASKRDFFQASSKIGGASSSLQSKSSSSAGVAAVAASAVPIKPIETPKQVIIEEQPTQRLSREQKRVKRLQRRQRQELAKLGGNTSLHSHVSNYYQLASNLYPAFPLIPELLPLKIMVKFVLDNSQQRLEDLWIGCNNSSDCDAVAKLKFVVGHYSCPLEAGNRLHKFMNALIWAVTTKRIFLWKYFDEATCREEESELATGTCDSFLNTPEDCSEILQLSDWVPSWDEWSQKLNLPTPVRACGIGTRDHDPISLPMDGDDLPRAVRIGQQLNLETGIVVGNPNNLYAKRLLQRKSSQATALQLFKQGHYFTYGMLFESLFTMHPSLFQELEGDAEADTYFLHARHPPARTDATNIGLELMCMDQILSKRPHPEHPCVMVTMTDREATRPLLEDALMKKYNCTPVVSANTTRGTAKFRPEHGSFAGRGYFQDIALAVQTRTGFMAPHLALRKGVGIRTSSALPREIVEFRRVLESANYESIPTYQECVGYAQGEK